MRFVVAANAGGDDAEKFGGAVNVIEPDTRCDKH